MSPIQAALLAVLLWFAYRLVRSPRDRGLRAVVACLLFTQLGNTGTLAEMLAVFGSKLSLSVGKLLLNISINFAWCSLMLFFLYSATGSQRRANWEITAAVGVSGVMTAAMFAAPAPVRDHAYPVRGVLPLTMHVPGMAVFYLVGAAYAAYASSQGARWALRYAAESTRRTRWALRVASLGLIAFACVSTLRSIIVLIRWFGGWVSPTAALAIDQLVPAGALLFALGVSSAGLIARVTALRVWARHRRHYRELRPLWDALHAEFPDDALDHRPRPAWRDRLSPRRVHRRYWRRVVEIRDGLVQLSPHLADAGYDPDQPVETQVDVFERALRRHHDGAEPTTRAAVLVAAPPHPDVEADVHQLVNLAHALPVKG